MRRKSRTRELAQGKWHGIIEHLLGPDAVKNRHGPCPICGGKDRYRFDDDHGSGNWICNVCGAGDGFKLLQLALGVSFARAAQMVDAIVNDVAERPFKRADSVVDLERRRHNLIDLWGKAKDPGVVQKYLCRERGIPMEIVRKAQDLRGLRRLMDYSTGHAWPGMVALVRDRTGKPVSLHRTFIGMPGPDNKRTMPPVGEIKGGYIRLAEPTDTLVLAEGIETALSAWALWGHPAWAVVYAQNMECFTSVPDTVKRVIICADHDESFTGQSVSFRLAWELKNKRKKIVSVRMPVNPGCDFNDVLKHGGRHEEQEQYYVWEYGHVE